MADTKKKNQNSVTRQNVLESLKDLGTGTASQATDFLKNTSEDFIREFRDKIGWYHISRYQKLSENFIREFKYEVNWWYISKYQTLSQDFKNEFKHKLILNDR